MALTQGEQVHRETSVARPVDSDAVPSRNMRAAREESPEPPMFQDERSQGSRQEQWVAGNWTPLIVEAEMPEGVLPEDPAAPRMKGPDQKEFPPA